MISDDLWIAMGRAGIERAPDLVFFFLDEDEASQAKGSSALAG